MIKMKLCNNLSVFARDNIDKPKWMISLDEFGEYKFLFPKYFSLS